MRPRLAVPAVAALLLTAACAMGDGMQEKLRDATEGYNSSLRWGDFDRAAEWLPSDAQDAFLSRHEAVDDKLVVVDYQMTRLDLDKEKGVAGSRAEILWHTDRQLVVKTTRVDQLWQFHEGRFVLVDERRSGGAPLAIFAEIGEGPHPYLPGLEAYRKAYEIGEDNKKKGPRRRKAADRERATARRASP
jgi:hypothetical protein